MDEVDSGGAKNWKLASILVIAFLVLCCSFPVLSCLRMPEPEATIKRFVIGSKISELEGQLGDWHPDDVETSDSLSSDTGKRIIKSRVGEFQEGFEGFIRLYQHSWVVPDDIRPSFMIELDYRDGKLISADYGILPG